MTCSESRVVVDFDTLNRLHAIKARVSRLDDRIKIKDMVAEALTAYCNDMEKELNLNSWGLK